MQPPDLSNFLGRLKHAMDVRKVDRAELARRMNVNYQNIRQLKTEMKAEYAVKAARALSVRIEWLALGEGEMDLPAKPPSSFAMEIARWFDDLPDRDRARGYTYAMHMFRSGRWPRLEDLQPDPEPTPAPAPDQETRRA